MTPLRREVPCRSQRDHIAAVAHFLIALGVLLTVPGLVPEPPARSADRVIGRRDLALRTMRIYAASPGWQEISDCPSVAALTHGRLDPWGGDYQVTCRCLESGERGLAVRSAGPDLQLGTADDLEVRAIARLWPTRPTRAYDRDGRHRFMHGIRDVTPLCAREVRPPTRAHVSVVSR